MKIDGSTIIVTGASSGIGAALASQLAGAGARVGIVARRADRLESVLAECQIASPDSEMWVADLSDLEVELDIQERDIARIAVGNRCYIMPEAFARDERFLKKHPNGYDGVYERRMPIASLRSEVVTVRSFIR